MRGMLGALWLAFAIVAFARPVEACSCSGPDSVIPRDGATAPRNTRIWIPPLIAKQYWFLHGIAEKVQSAEPDAEPTPDELARAVVLVGPEQRSVEFEMTDIRVGLDSLFFAVIPRAELSPGSYELRPSAPVPRHVGQWVHAMNFHFTVADARIERPPAIPAAAVGKWTHLGERESMCSSTAEVRLRVEHEGWLLVYQLYDPTKQPKRESIDYDVTDGSDFVIDNGACGPSWDFTRGPAIVRFGSIDLVGKFSGFGPPVPLDPPWPKEPMKRSVVLNESRPPHGCGCRAGSRSPEDAPRALVFLLAGLAFASRRRGGDGRIRSLES